MTLQNAHVQHAHQQWICNLRLLRIFTAEGVNMVSDLQQCQLCLRSKGQVSLKLVNGDTNGANKVEVPVTAFPEMHWGCIAERVHVAFCSPRLRLSISICTAIEDGSPRLAANCIDDCVLAVDNRLRHHVGMCKACWGIDSILLAGAIAFCLVLLDLQHLTESVPRFEVVLV
jgi:hypothetical protein